MLITLATLQNNTNIKKKSLKHHYFSSKFSMLESILKEQNRLLFLIRTYYIHFVYIISSVGSNYKGQLLYA